MMRFFILSAITIIGILSSCQSHSTKSICGSWYGNLNSEIGEAEHIITFSKEGMIYEIAFSEGGSFVQKSKYSFDGGEILCGSIELFAYDEQGLLRDKDTLPEGRKYSIINLEGDKMQLSFKERDVISLTRK
jgi:hypothetical protein